MSRLAPTDPKVRVVTAPAGSGKTTVLLQRYLDLLKHDVPAHRIVAITFTRKAAAEMVERLAVLLDAAAGRSKLDKKQQELYGEFLPSRKTADEALRQLDALPVCTVDAFVLSLLREFALDAHFVLRDGTKLWIDGPVDVSGDTSAAWQQAAREALEKLGPGARVLLRHLTMGQAIEDLADLATTQVPGLWQSPKGAKKPAAARTAGELFDLLGAQLAGKLKTTDQGLLDLLCFRTRDPDLNGPATAWLQKPKGPPPAEALHCLAKLKRKDEPGLCDGRNKALAAALGAFGLHDLDSDDLAWDRWRDKEWMGPWFGGGNLDLPAEVQLAFAGLVPQVRDGALRLLARDGRFTHDLLLTAATTLCADDPPAELQQRFDALLVDELQDTNPAQLAFHRAFEGMRSDAKGIRAFYVGDARQSIYRFRGADPYGWQSLVAEAVAGKSWTWLKTNYRSSKQLVEAQKTAFGHLVDEGETGVEALSDVEAPDRAAAGALSSAKYPAPVVVIDSGEEQPDDLALLVFAERVKEQWEVAPGQTAAVLVRAWHVGAKAVKLLRGLGVPAQLTGDKALLTSRVATDLRLFLRALVDLTDDIALAGMLKHPSVGLSDRGLMLLRASGGFGRIFVPDVELPALDDGDRARIETVLPIMRDARRRLGREPTADVLEWLAGQLEWRPVVAAGPESEDGTGFAQLEILLDVVRGLESEGVNPQGVIDGLVSIDEASSDLPVVRLHGGAGVVTVTTYFGAKGLEFDHVALCQVDKEGAGGVSTGNAWLLALPRGQAVFSARVDPGGGLEPKTDPLGALGTALCKRESREEGFRLFYVGFTRAKRSVTFGLDSGSGKGESVTDVLRKVFIEQSRLGSAVRVVPADQVPRQPTVLRLRKPLGRVAPPVARWVEPRGLVMARATGAEEAGLPAKEIEKQYRERAKVVVGKPGPARPVLKAYADVSAATWGEVVHGWMERWGLVVEPTVEAAAAYLKEDWSAEEPTLAKWLVGAGLAVRDGLDGFAELLEGQLHFERPVLGKAGQYLWTGRPDLVVEFPNREVIVVDFKAGDKFATADDIPDFRQYAVQLETYRRILKSAGYDVIQVGLVYVTGPSWVRIKV